LCVLGLSPCAHPCTRLCVRYNKSAYKVLKDFTAIVRHEEGNTGSFSYIISLFGGGDGEGGRPRKTAPEDDMHGAGLTTS